MGGLKGHEWKWSSACDNAVKQCNDLLLSQKVLVHSDSRKPLRLATDASPFGVGAVLSHVMENGEEKPIAFASRTLLSRTGRSGSGERRREAARGGAKRKRREAETDGLCTDGTDSFI